MARITRPGNAQRRFTEFDVDHLDDDHKLTPTHHPQTPPDNLSFHLKQTPQANHSIKSSKQSFQLDPELRADEVDVGVREFSFESADQSHSQLAPDSAYGGSPYTNTIAQTEPNRKKSKVAKNFVCTQRGCRKAFARRSDLVRHNRIHTNER